MSHMIHSLKLITILIILISSKIGLYADATKEFKIKRESVFTFTKKPTMSLKDGVYTITFETTGNCDVTIAIEDQNKKIFRHLASGVLGENAPEPFQKNTKKQIIHWDGKDDAGRYVANVKSLQVRVSLGLKPRLERTLAWSPHKRTTAWRGANAQSIAITKEGVYVYQGAVFDYVRLFDHSGNYKKTIYPFPSKNINSIKGMAKHTFPHDNKTLPLKKGYYQTTLLQGKSTPLNVKRTINGLRATGLVVYKDRVTLLGKRLITFSTNGKTQDLDFEGPEITLPFRAYGAGADREIHYVNPSFGAFSPDGNTLYVSGYIFRHPMHFNTLHGVGKIDLKKNNAMTTFAGNLKQDKKGTSNNEFNNAVAVACDSKGRVYVADHTNDRVQIFSPEGVFLKTIKCYKPSQINIHPKTDEIYVFSWVVYNRTLHLAKKRKKIVPTLTHYGSFESPQKKGEYKLPLPTYPQSYYRGIHTEWDQRLVGKTTHIVAQMDFWSKEPKVWMSRRQYRKWEKSNIQILGFKKDKLIVLKDFAKEVEKANVRQTPPILNRQRLYVNPKDGHLFVGESDGGVGKSMQALIKINPNTGKSKVIQIPYDSEDICFDQQGFIYLRTGKVVGRFNPVTWKEVPWDYGVEKSSVSYSSNTGARRKNLISAIMPPGHRAYSWWHLGGMSVSAKGNLVIHTAGGANAKKMNKTTMNSKNKYNLDSGEDPRVLGTKSYPGRYHWGLIYIFDKHGHYVVKDAAPGIGMVDGLFLDAQDNIYTMASGRRLSQGKSYDPKLTDDLSETLIKFKGGKVKFLSSRKSLPLVLPESSYPKRSAEIEGNTMGGAIWVEGAQWFYGGVGFAGKNGIWAGGGCACWNSRFALDYYARSFVPELRHYSIAVLDTNGNLIMRIGRYGNIDEGKPIIQEGGPLKTTAIGGDEVSLFHGAYLATDTDKRLFIADDGNSRILSVKLDYHTNELLPLSK